MSRASEFLQMQLRLESIARNLCEVSKHFELATGESLGEVQGTNLSYHWYHTATHVLAMFDAMPETMKMLAPNQVHVYGKLKQAIKLAGFED